MLPAVAPPPRGPRDVNGELVTMPANLPMPRSTPMRTDQRPAPPQRPMNDLTTTMPIIIPPLDEHGRHRSGMRVPKAVKVGGIFAVAVGVGIAVAGSFGGSHSTPGTDAQAGTSAPVVADPTGSAADTPTDPNATPPASADSQAPTPKATKAHTAAPKPTTTTTSAPVIAAPPAPTTPSPTPTTSAPFKALHQGDTGPAVAQMQQELLAGCFLTPGYQLGVFDHTTYFAVRMLQNMNPGTSTADGRGVFGAATSAALLRDPNGIC